MKPILSFTFHSLPFKTESIEHKYSDYSWDWHCKFGKRGQFQTDKLWKVARAIMSQNLMGAIRLKHIFKLYNIDAGPNSDGAVQKYKREEDMLNRVLAVFAAVGSKVPLSIFDNDYIKAYIHQLDPKHRRPHQLERNRIVEVIMDLGMLEFKQIVNERRDELGNSFVSVTTDFG